MLLLKAIFVRSQRIARLAVAELLRRFRVELLILLKNLTKDILAVTDLLVQLPNFILNVCSSLLNSMLPATVLESLHALDACLSELLPGLSKSTLLS